jgi:arabinose-5-phosphate isomerase
MTKDPIRIRAGSLALEALKLMEERPSPISVLPVVDENQKPVGLLRLHDLVRAGL